ncbi:hypothetical protein FRACYDRAFT_204168 [Fragilariopsis cylindrus CCMP1102]|uniref:Uncharacterized protein n=1 Tax=Fragilariopsis cylindrus CCMP1102 TaxID=635003 RepID=A0A1E7EIV8_9STRA|nr:hypothetical protein FRACYDRAFT_204168 [Fragilariopsis cylindrus CCMP1102]|eukprot:OEU05825.1 hypothetical protein FRACYDRAFT_204168 [Fragilariopsis cylindrus CCMP1102]
MVSSNFVLGSSNFVLGSSNFVLVHLICLGSSNFVLVHLIFVLGSSNFVLVHLILFWFTIYGALLIYGDQIAKRRRGRIWKMSTPTILASIFFFR